MKPLLFLLSRFKISLLFLSILLPLLLPTTQAAEDANQIQASILLQIPMAKSISLTNVVLDGEGTTTDLELERFEVFSPDAQIIVHNSQGREEIKSPPSTAYFKGHVIDDADSLVVLSADPSGTMRGIVKKENKLWILAGGTAIGATPVGLISEEVAQSGKMNRSAPFQCGVEGKMQELTAPPLPKINNLPIAQLSPGQFYQVKVAIETDGEFYNLFGNSSAAVSYIGDLFAYSSVIYNREAEARLIVGSVSLWSGGPISDPWSHTDTLDGLLDFQEYWNTNRSAVSRTIAHFLSGRNLGGGIAYLGALCNSSYGYGYSANLDGQFRIGNPQPVWDIIVVAHEIGHNFSSPHTHCYGGIGGNSNPIDACYNQEQGEGCWTGGISLPGLNSLTGGTGGGGNGTIMSYCHLLYPGYSNISLTFGQSHGNGIQANRVSTKIASYVASVASSYPNCITIGGGAQNYTVSLNKTGTGSGTVSGGGTYAAGAMVNLAATPAAGSAFAGWSPSPCAASFTMPANNLTCTATFNLISSKPDLVVTSVTSPSSGVIGELVSDFSMTIKNQGTANAGAFRAKIYLSTDTNITTNDIDTGWGCDYSPLAVSEASACGGNVGIPASVAPGSYYLGVYADAANVVSESNESNNGRAPANQITLNRGGSPLPVYRFYNMTAGGHFFTMNEEEKNTVINNYKWFRYEGIGFKAYSFQVVGNILPVYRFYNMTAGGHFFTLNEGEKDTVINNYKWFRFEGVGFYAFPFQAAGTLPVYRFYNMTAGGHFFTMNEAERDTVINNYKWFRYEGIGFYAWPASQ